MNLKLSALAFGALCAACMIDAEAATSSVEAFANATVQPSGPRGGNNGTNFFNIEGSDNGSFASYGVARFDVSAARAGFDAQFGVGGWGLDTVELELVQSNAAFTNDGPVAVYFTEDDAVSLVAGGSPLRYANFAADFADAVRVVDYPFVEASSGTRERHALYDRALAHPGGATLAADIASDSLVTLLLRDGSAGVAATYAGYSNTFAGPTLVLSAVAVPEPSRYAMLVSGLGLAGLALRRRSR